MSILHRSNLVTFDHNYLNNIQNLCFVLRICIFNASFKFYDITVEERPTNFVSDIVIAIWVDIFFYKIVKELIISDIYMMKE